MNDKDQRRPTDATPSDDVELEYSVDPSSPSQPSDKANPEPSATDSQLEATPLQSDTVAYRPGQRPAPVRLPERFGRYQIKRQLGQGGMGAVYLAHDQQLDRNVALKVPFFDENDGPEVIHRFYREARAMAALRHPNLCPVFDVGEIDGVHFMAMAYIDGHPLNKFLKKGKAVSARQGATVVRKLALALEEAHRADIIHRDLKPANVMIDARKEPIVMDFGLARRDVDGETALTQAGTMIGTPSYMAPELVKGLTEEVGPAADIFALGVMLYEMICGRKPFEGSLAAVLSQILLEEPTPPHEVDAAIPAELTVICLKAMSKAIDDRYPTANDLAVDLDRFLKGIPVGAGAAPATASAEPKPDPPAADPTPTPTATPAAQDVIRRPADTTAPSMGTRLRKWGAIAGVIGLILLAVVVTWTWNGDAGQSGQQATTSPQVNPGRAADSDWSPSTATTGSQDPTNPFDNNSGGMSNTGAKNQDTQRPKYTSGSAVGSAPPSGRDGATGYTVASNSDFNAGGGPTGDSNGASQSGQGEFSSAAPEEEQAKLEEAGGWSLLTISFVLFAGAVVGTVAVRRTRKWFQQFAPSNPPD